VTPSNYSMTLDVTKQERNGDEIFSGFVAKRNGYYDTKRPTALPQHRSCRQTTPRGDSKSATVNYRKFTFHFPISGSASYHCCCCELTKHHCIIVRPHWACACIMIVANGFRRQLTTCGCGCDYSWTFPWKCAHIVCNIYASLT